MINRCNILGEGVSLTRTVKGLLQDGGIQNVEVLSGLASGADISPNRLDEPETKASSGCLLRDPKHERTIIKIGACATCVNNPNTRS